MDDNIIPFPSQISRIARDLELICDEAVDIQERSEALLRWAEDMLYELQLPMPANDNYESKDRT